VLIEPSSPTAINAHPRMLANVAIVVSGHNKSKERTRSRAYFSAGLPNEK